MTRSSEVKLPEEVPAHVAIIMDGNGRWARKRGLPRLAGHRAGVENLRRILEASAEFGIKYLTIYAFSTENWERPAAEVRGLINILEDVIDQELETLHQNGVQLRHLGRLERLGTELQEKVRHAIELTNNNQQLILNVAWNYGGRDEIVHAIQRMIEDGLKPEDVTEERVSEYLYTSKCPDPDLIIRTSGEMRVSNFLIWQGAYSEWYVTPTYWPEFGPDELLKALHEYAQRERRYGRISDPIKTN
ncbi:MAG: isoprenyl transferase [Anaerolineales bacterium]|nr:isoprenyl transferase [Anaerolineales bacterium]